MSWAEVLDRLEADALRIVAAAEGPAEELEAAWQAALNPDVLSMPPLPPELVDRAKEVLRVIAAAEEAVARRATTVRRGIDAVGAAGGDREPARFIDREL